MTSCYVNSDHDNRNEVLSDEVFAYNNLNYSTTGFSPNELVLGKRLKSATKRK